MPKISDIYGKKPWFGAADLQDGEERRLVVARFAYEQLASGLRDVLWFKDEDQYLFLDRFTAPAIAKLLGDDTDDWPGQPIVMFAEVLMRNGKVSFNKDGVPTRVLRFKADTPAVREITAEEKARKKVATDIDDEIPF